MTATGSFEIAADAPLVIGDWIRSKAERNGDRVALEIVGREKSYAAVDRDSDRVAAGLSSLGLGAGDHASLMMTNSLENVDAWFGMVKAGIVEVPINTANRGYLLQYMIDQSDSRAIVCDEPFVERLVSVAADLPTLEHVVVNRSTDGPLGHELPARIAVHDLADLYLDLAPPRPPLKRDDVAVILYTSGTTGPSKGVLLPHEMNLTVCRHLVWLNDYDADDVLYTVFPLFHINAKYTSVMAAMEADAKLVMEDRFSASTFWATCRAKHVTAFNYQGALLMMLYKQPERRDDADNPVRRAFGAPAPPEIWRAFERRFDMQLNEVYGMTETSTTLQNTPGASRVGSCGKPMPFFEVAIHDRDDRPVGPGVEGEIVVRPKRPNIMIREYYKMPDQTLEAFRNLWFHTGDRGRTDEDGFFYFVDRMKDAIRRRGENISSWEIEKVVNTHDAVLETAAYGVTSELSEEEVMVAVVLKAGAALAPEALLDFCTEHMAHFAVPRYVRFVASLPKTPSQRIEKYRLREEGVTADTWDREAHGYSVRR